jgi:hypothetical protein
MTTIDIPASLATLLPTLHLQPPDDAWVAAHQSNSGDFWFWAAVFFVAALLLAPIMRRLAGPKP